MVLNELYNGKFVVQNGVVSTLTPLTTIEKIEKEIRKEIEANLTKNSGKEAILKLLGSAIEYFTENGWKIHFINESPDELKLLIGCQFNGGVMKGNSREAEKNNKPSIFEVYIPSGYLCMYINVYDFPNIGCLVKLLPRYNNLTLKELYSEHSNVYHTIHPHCFGSRNGDLCCGLILPTKFDIDLIVSQIKACVYGSKIKLGTSIWDYNRDSPACDIMDCITGQKAFEWHKVGLSDEEIWKKLLN